MSRILTVFGSACLVVVAASLSYAQSSARIWWTEWKEFSASLSRIQCSAIDGTDVQTVVSGLQTAPGPKGIAVDPSNGKTYWGHPGDDTIERCDHDGSNRETVVSGVNPQGITLDAANGKVYWADYTYANPRIRRASMDGGETEDLVSNSTGCGLEGIALDSSGGKVYWVERLDNEIWRANLNGGGEPETLVSNLSLPYGIALVSGRGGVRKAIPALQMLLLPMEQ